MTYQERKMANASERKEIVIVLDFGDRPTGLEPNPPSNSANIIPLQDSIEREEIDPIADHRARMIQKANDDSDTGIVNLFEDPQYEVSDDNDFDSNGSDHGGFEDNAWEQPTIASRNYLSREENAICMRMWQIVDRLEEKARSTPFILTPELFNAWRQFEGAMLGVPRDQIEEYVPVCLDSRHHDAFEDDPTEPLLAAWQVSALEINPGDIPSDFAQTAGDVPWMDLV
jgi:hypothetical protein